MRSKIRESSVRFSSKKFLLVSLALLISAVFLLSSRQSSSQFANTNSAFITRNGSILYNNGKPFRFAGANIHWLGIYDGGSYPSQYEINDALATAQEMGATVVRSFMTASVGCSLCIEPSLNRFNDNAFNTIDYAVKSAHDHNIRLILALVLQGTIPTYGGTGVFTNWEGKANVDDFYTNAAVINDYEAYISHVLNHINQYTGIALKDDPTIMAWETGNEVRTLSADWNDAWTETIAAYIKSIAPHQLIADGHYAESNSNSLLTTSQLQLANVDLYTDHLYPLNISTMQANAILTHQYNRVYYVGEYDWTDQATIPAEGTISQDKTTSSNGTYSAKVHITKSNPNWWYLQLSSNTFRLQSRHTYTISFDTKASARNTLVVSLQQTLSPYSEYSRQMYHDLGSSWSHYSFKFTPTTTLSSVLINFNYAVNTGTIWIDNVSLSSGSANLLKNSSFENAGADWLSPWKFHIKSGTGDPLASFLPTTQTTPGLSGLLYWQLYGHIEPRGYYTGGDQYKLFYPGNTPSLQNREQLLRMYDYKMSGVSPAPAHIIPLAPLLNSATSSQNGISIDWLGSAGAANYNIERSTDGSNWRIVATGLTDYSTPWTDKTAVSGTTYYYRVQPVNLDGVKGSYSNTKTLCASCREGTRTV